VALGKLLTPVCLCQQAVIIWYQPRGSDLFGWKSNCRPDGK